ncbi:MAG: hypothetical protein JOZ57_18325 [Abitibacteriaceae bacterium]|nr:hypothetical protein [Abditibacteriaceae bacterium]
MLSIFGLRIDLDWFYNHADREIIQRWTVDGADTTRQHELVIKTPEPPAAEWCFLALGDTGDSDRFGSRISPQSAVATFMAQDCGLLAEAPTGEPLLGAPPVQPTAQMLIHTGDINYLTGEQRLYDLNFVDPYRPFLTEQSHYNNLIFRIPFLPVPGNHDYYDLHGWVAGLMKLGSWLGFSKLLTHFFYRIGLSVPLGGSDMGASYMTAFVESAPDRPQPLPYQPGVRTRLPNRYYQFRRGNVHCFALDSNTLDAPPPGTADPFKEKAHAIVERTERKLGHLNEQVKRDREWEQEETMRQREAMRAGQHADLWPYLQSHLHAVATSAAALSAATNRWADKLATATPETSLPETNSVETALPQTALPQMDSAQAAQHLKALAQQNQDLHDQWSEILKTIEAAPEPVPAYEAQLDSLADLQEAWLHHLAQRDQFTVTLPGAPEYEAARQARLALDASLGQWCRQRVGSSLSGPCALAISEEEEEQEETDLSEAILDTQRDLAMARKLSQRSDEDYDAAQIEWLKSGLAAVKAEEAEQQRHDPSARIWRIVYLHHPIYTTLPSHAEHGDSIGVRHNLEAILKDADLVISGHSHGFEWLRSQAAPHQCYLVAGAGGQGRLQGSIFSPLLAGRYGAAKESLVQAGLTSLVWASGDPVMSGATVEHKLFSYLRIRVLPDELRVEPVGVRQLEAPAPDTPPHATSSDDALTPEAYDWERVYPMPVHEVADLPSGQHEGSISTPERRLHAIRIRRGQPPEAVWAE